MGGHGMTKDDLTQELAQLRRRIAELESLEESCRSSETNLKEMYRRVVEDLPDLICRYKPDTTITFVNESYAKYFDKTVGELVGTSFLELIPPEDHEYVRKGISSLTEEAPLITMEHKVLTADGMERWQLWRDRAIFDGSGNITEIQSIGRDITERKMAEVQLKKAIETVEEEKVKSETIIACMGDAVSIQDRDFRVIFQNDVHKRLAGGDKAGQYCYKAYVNSDRVCEGCSVEAAFKDGGVHRHERRRSAQNGGRELYFEIVASPLRNSEGEIVAGIEMVRDITSRKEAEEELERSAFFFDTIPDVLSVTDERGIIKKVNRAFSKLFGYDPEEVVGKTVFNMFPPNEISKHEREIEKAITNGETRYFETIALTKTGEKVPISLTGRALSDESGNVTELIAVMRDITDRKEAEKKQKEVYSRLETLIESIPYAVYFKDAVGRHVVVNKACCEFLSLPKEELLGKTCEEVMPSEVARSCRLSDDNVFEGRRTIRIEDKIAGKDGNNIYLETIKTPLYDEYGNVEGLVGMSRDITSIKRSEEMLRRSEERFREMTELLPGIVFEMDTAGRLTYVNQNGFETLGYPREDYDKGMNAFDLIGPDYRARAIEDMKKVFKGNFEGPNEYTLIKKGGSTFPCIITASPIVQSGDVVGARGVILDISQHEMVEEELKYRNLLLSTQMETSLDGILVVDENGKWMSFNQRFVDMWGLPDEIVKLKSDEEAIRFVLDKLVDPDGFIARVKYLYEHTDETSSEEVVLNDGRTIDRYSAPINSQAGEYFGRVWYFRDITRRKKTEEVFRGYQEHLQEMVSERTAELTERTAELTAAIEMLQEQISERTRGEKFIKNILESIDESLIVLGLDYRIISANRAFCESMKMPIEDIKGKPCHELLHGKQKPCYESGEDCSVRKVFTTGEPSTAAHTHNRGGSSLFIETKTYPMRDDEGNIGSVIQVINDVSEKRKLENQLRHSQKMEAIGQLAGGVAHDFNNRLAAIMNYAFILKTNMSPDNPLLVHVNQIMNSSERAAHLTQNLLTFSRKHVINPRPVKLNDVVEGIEKLLARVIGEDIGLETELSEDELVVMADSGQIEHVLINLATNARDSVRGSGRVSISTSHVTLGPEFFEGRSSAKAGHYALISFIDTGGGMDAETKGKIFEPFFTTKGVGKGTGLGLSIVYGIVKQHGGQITVESEPNVGTAFYIYLPLLPVRAEQAEPEAAAEPTGGNETVLLVEDDEDVRKPLRQMLEGFGYDVVEAVNGKDAIEKFLQSRKNIGLLVLDVILPGLNGIEVLRAIRKVQPSIRAIFTSGYSKEHVWSKGLPMPGTAFLSKPVAPELLLEKVREALDG